MALIATLGTSSTAWTRSAPISARCGSEVTGQSDIDRNVVATMDAAGNLVDLALPRSGWACPPEQHQSTHRRRHRRRPAQPRTTLPQVVADSRMTRLAGELNDPDALAARLGL